MAMQLYLTLKNWFARQEGQDVVEYAVLVVFIAILVIAGALAFGQQMNDIYGTIITRIQAGFTAAP